MYYVSQNLLHGILKPGTLVEQIANMGYSSAVSTFKKLNHVVNNVSYADIDSEKVVLYHETFIKSFK